MAVAARRIHVRGPHRAPSAHTLQTFQMPSGAALPFVAGATVEFCRSPWLPVSDPIVLESKGCNCDGRRVLPEAARVANWKPVAERNEEIPFVVARAVLQDFNTGVPLLCDLAAMRTEAANQGKNPKTSCWCRWTWSSTSSVLIDTSATRTRSTST